ncbi:hypothetical protein BAUCODRAFT_286072 [Baudoinia panamericana UAMH 10762]|uniref:F-box domain-containing protein n=1 Tax=Baudoinia panamericana (strain UAMH 10762) TaxID=717646 RepID=M2N141_BAUPA|nr:uncharacterized protein BAUCODRAFT_286072 [Baudoinia panamericana UAMH 10762]EMC92355.1 hypothetical protein BAUCODRAFT_286072 [Baudoinia panamericana UAMH 10762]
MATLTNLPVELVELVASFLTIEELATARQACGFLREACSKLFNRRLDDKVLYGIHIRDDYVLWQRADAVPNVSIASMLAREMAFMFSIIHNDYAAERFTRLTLYGINFDYQNNQSLCQNFRQLRFPKLVELSLMTIRVHEVEDVAALIRINAPSLDDVCIRGLSVADIRTFATDWIQLLTFMSDDMHLTKYESRIDQPGLRGLFETRDPKSAFYDSKHRPVEEGSVECEQYYKIANNILFAQGAAAVPDGITAQIAHIRHKKTLLRAKRVISLGFGGL